MPLEVEKKERENPRRLVRRFCQGIRKSGLLKKAKRGRFYQRPLSKAKKKLSALRRERIKKELAQRTRLGA